MADMTELEGLELIQTKLTSDITYATIELFPDKPTEYFFLAPKSAVLLSGGGATGNAPRGSVSMRTVLTSIEVTAISRSLNDSEHGIYTLTADVWKSIESNSVFMPLRYYLTVLTNPVYDEAMEAWVRNMSFVMPDARFLGV